MMVSGWALDLSAARGSGVDAVHVWAFPAGGGKPVFLGIADLGDPRPDVAAVYGRQFERSAFSLAAPHLADGTYDIVAFAHRTATGAFDAESAVRVTIGR
jgi:hypothetical protein